MPQKISSIINVALFVLGKVKNKPSKDEREDAVHSLKSATVAAVGASIATGGAVVAIDPELIEMLAAHPISLAIYLVAVFIPYVLAVYFKRKT